MFLAILFFCFFLNSNPVSVESWYPLVQYVHLYSYKNIFSTFTVWNSRSQTSVCVHLLTASSTESFAGELSETVVAAEVWFALLHLLTSKCVDVLTRLCRRRQRCRRRWQGGAWITYIQGRFVCSCFEYYTKQ